MGAVVRLLFRQQSGSTPRERPSEGGFLTACEIQVLHVSHDAGRHHWAPEVALLDLHKCTTKGPCFGGVMRPCFGGGEGPRALCIREGLDRKVTSPYA